MLFQSGVYTKDAAEKVALRSKEPVVFDKALSSLVYYPNKCLLYSRGDILVESELGIIIGKSGKDIGIQDADDFIGGYNFMCDFTDTRAVWYRQNGYSFTCAKSLDNYTPVGRFIEKSEIPDYNNLDISCQAYDGKGEKTVDFSGNSQEFVFSPKELIHFLSQGMTLNAGDLILTGTPTNAKVFDGQKVSMDIKVGDKVLDKMEFDLEIKKIAEYNVENL